MALDIANTAAELTPIFSGQLLRPGDATYDDARRVHNGLIDKRPALIARCRGVADVADAVGIAQKLRLETAVRGGGHNVAGRATVEGGVMIDLALMKGIHVDPTRRTARAQGGVTWGELNRETQVHGLAVTGGVVSTTGIAGLTLGGGLGWLMGKYALAVDNLLSVDLVLANGRAVTASAKENADLFWAVRGGGGNFGIATSLEYRLHPVGPQITGGLIAYPFDRAWDVLRHYRDVASQLPDEISMAGTLVHAPDGSGQKLAAMVLCHCGSLAAGDRALQPIKAFGKPAIDAIGPIPYTQMNTLLDAAYPRGALNYWKSRFLAALSDDAIRAMIDCFARCPTPMGQILLEHYHGAVTRIGPTDTAFPHRSPGHSALVLAQWMDRGQNAACISWARESFAALQSFMGAGSYVNNLDGDEPQDAVAEAYGPNYRRLQQIKAKYDPENFFRLNQNIRPLA